MITQKPIAVKIDLGLLDDLDKEVSLGWRKRNGHINEAIRFYLDYKDTYRRYRSYSVEERSRLRDDLLDKWFPR